MRRDSARDLSTLERRSRRPRRLRQPRWSLALEQAVLKLRRRYPSRGKDQLAVLVRGEGRTVSVSIGGPHPGAPQAARGAGRAARRDPHLGARTPKDYIPQAPDDLVEVDTLAVRPLPGLVFKHFTARDVISRWM